jgi:hypothetical protein
MIKFSRILPVILSCTLWVTAGVFHDITTALAAPPKPVAKKATVAKKAASVLVVQGKIKAIARTPRPGATPYKDVIVAIHLTGVKALRGKFARKEILVFTWGMRNIKWTRAASYRAGQSIAMKLQPWEKVERKYGGYSRVDLEGDDVFVLDAYWGE